MADKSRIEWTEATWNPVTGCTRVSAGCDHCYAARLTAGRLSRHPRYAGLTAKNAKGDWHFNGTVHCHEDLLDQPLRWKRPRMIFVCSMADLFHPAVPDDFIREVLWTVQRCGWHTFQLLTKRPKRPAEFMHGAPALDNLWLGTSCEDQKTADERIPHLLRCPAAVRWLSLEPLLSEINLNTALRGRLFCRCGSDQDPSCSRCVACGRDRSDGASYLSDLRSINWVVVGGETGTGARPMHPDLPRSIRDQCQAAKVPFFFKQWGNNMPWDDGVRVCTGNAKHVMERVSKKVAGRLLDGREWNEMPQRQGTKERRHAGTK